MLLNLWSEESFSSLFFFLIGRKLHYSSVLVSAIYQHQSATGVHMSSPSGTPVPLEPPSSLPVMKGKAQGNRSKNDKEDLGKSRRDVQISQTDTTKDVLEEGVGSSC